MTFCSTILLRAFVALSSSILKTQRRIMMSASADARLNDDDAAVMVRSPIRLPPMRVLDESILGLG